MVSGVVKQLCDDCLKKKDCDYIPTSGKLLRCLDRQTVQPSENPATDFPDGDSDPNAQDS
ncbi:MAG: hypothetical protein P8123_08880 [bacterium]|jgi:hypothetical protein